jgi:hypothetical protein
MSKVIEGVPERIARGDVTRLVESLGFQAEAVRRIEINPSQVAVEVFDPALCSPNYFQTILIPVVDDVAPGELSLAQLRQWCEEAGMTGLDLDTSLAAWQKDPNCGSASRVRSVLNAHITSQDEN